MTWQLLVLPFVAMIASQLIKLATNEVKGDFNFKGFLTSYGGMPSSHAAFVASVATLVGLEAGFLSPLFALTVVFAFTVLRDAVGLRQEISHQAAIIKYLLDSSPAETKKKFPLHLRVGHTFTEVIIGSLFGIAVALLGYYLL